jgi:Transglycosylase SLT domain
MRNGATRPGMKGAGARSGAFLLLCLALLTQAASGNAAIPTTDAARQLQETDTKNHVLDTDTSKAKQKGSSKNIRCNFRRSKEQALDDRGDVARKIAQTCARVGVEPALGLSIAYQESQFNQACRAPKTPWSGGERAQGVMQLLPATAKRVGLQYVGRPLDAGNEDDNILAGCLYLKEGGKITSGSEHHTIAGYHNGYNRRVMRENLALPKGWKNGRAYVDAVQNRHLPYFRSVMDGRGDPGRFQSDQLQGTIFTASANGISDVQGAQGTMMARLMEQAQTSGQSETTLLAWQTNARARLSQATVQNMAIDALQILMQQRLAATLSETTDQSGTADLMRYDPERPDKRRWPQKPAGSQLLASDQRWLMDRRGDAKPSDP